MKAIYDQEVNHFFSIQDFGTCLTLEKYLQEANFGKRWTEGLKSGTPEKMPVSEQK